MLQFDGGQAQCTDSFPAWPGPNVGPLPPVTTPVSPILGPTMQGTGVLVSTYNNLADLQMALRDPEGGGGIGWREGPIIQGITPGQFVFPKAIGMRVRNHNPGQTVQVIAQVWETIDGPLPQTPLSTNIGTLGSGGSFTPGPSVSQTGVVLPFAGTVVPSGFLLCDGSSYLRAAFTTLFNAIGTQFGAADGNHFNVPDLVGRVVVMTGPNADVNALGRSDGLAAANRSPIHNSSNGLALPNHGHSLSDPGHTHLQHTWAQSLGGGGTGNVGGVGHSNSGFQGDDDIGLVVTGTGISIGGTTSSPPIAGQIGPGGSRPTDAPGFLTLNYIIAT